jgi:outer membrane protein insertion porin family/translocation and assembly module TamA
MQARPGAPRARWLRAATLFLLSFAVPRIVRAQDISCDRDNAKQVRSLNFQGNETFSADELSARVIVTASSFTHRYFRWLFNAGSARCLPADGLSDDVDRLKAFYRNNGFYETKIEPTVTQLPPDQVDVTFKITEGPPLRATSFAITGLDSVPDSAAIVRDLPIGKGQRIGMLLLLQAVDTITSRLRNAGYPHVDVLRSFKTNPSQRTASVELQVLTGMRARIGTINIMRAGPTATKAPQIDSAVVLRMLGFRTGDWYSDRALTNARRNLYNLGTYLHVGIEADTVSQPTDQLIGINVDLREDYMRQIQPEEGWAQLDCFRVNATYTDKNFLDRAQRIDVTGRVSKLGFGEPTHWGPLCDRGLLEQDSIGSSKLNYYLGATVRQPAAFGGSWVPAYSAYTERRGQFKAYLRTTYIGTDVSATRNIAVTTPFRLGYSLEYGQTIAEPAFLCALFTLCTEAEQKTVQRKLPLGVASASLQQVRVDNIVEPRSGYIAGGELRGSSRVIGSNDSLEFVKAFADASLYRPLTARITLALRLRGGVIGGTNLPPPQERLYAGGAASVRGFQQNELGPVVYLVDSGTTTAIIKHSQVPGGVDSVAFVTTASTSASRTIPTGGNRLVVANAELRIRDPFIPNLLEYVPFVDAGDVYTSHTGSARNEKLAVTPGLGLRYFSPIGPIQVNAGYNPQRTRVGPAYFTPPVRSNGTAPLICVTAPGAPLAFVKYATDGITPLSSDSNCPASFIPSVSNSFFSHFVLTFSIGTDF